MNKDRHDRGFTLAELLIVVAIIGVLVAISIPIFTSQLDKASLATDLANERAAKAAAIAYYYNNNPSLPTNSRSWAAFTYDADNGAIYYKTGANSADARVTKGYNKSGDHTGFDPGTAVVVVRLQYTGNGSLAVKNSWAAVKKQ